MPLEKYHCRLMNSGENTRLHISNITRHASFPALRHSSNLLICTESVVKLDLLQIMAHDPIGSYLRTHRRSSGLTLQELASLLGYRNETQVLRHEQSHTLPPLSAALSYQCIFQVPLTELFPGVYRTVDQIITERLAQLEIDLQGRHAKGPGASATARKLEWLCERKGSI
jgi:transcriptional regulator with XRE-family HTH domain